MKEQMPNVILSGAKNLEANGSLTTRSFHPTLIVDGDIFMAEQQGESSSEHLILPVEKVEAITFVGMDVNRITDEASLLDKNKLSPSEQVLNASDLWRKRNAGERLSPEEQDWQIFLRANGLGPDDPVSPELRKTWEMERKTKLFSTSEFQAMHAKATAQKVQPETHEMQRLREKLSGTVVKGFLPTIDLTGIFDLQIRSIGNAYNEKRTRGLVDYEEMRATVKELEQRLSTPGAVTDPREITAVRDILYNTTNGLLAGMADEKRAAEGRTRASEAKERERQSRNYYIKQRIETEYSVSQLISDPEARDEVFNNLFAGVDSTPHRFFQEAFNPLTRGMRLEYFMDLIRDASNAQVEDWSEVVHGKTPQQIEDLQTELANDYLRYQTEYRMRQSLHDLNAALYIPSLTGDQLWEHMGQFSSELGDVAFKTAGVRQMMDIYEQEIKKSMERNNGYLKPEEVVGTTEAGVSPGGTKIKVRRSVGVIEERTLRRFIELNGQGKIVVKDSEGVIHPVEVLQKWEADRVFSIARGMMIATERLLSLAAESKLPNKSYSSLFGQDILQQYSSYIHLLGKYGLSEKNLAAYLVETKSDEGPGFWAFLRRWSPADLKKALKEYEEDATGFLNDPGEENQFRHLMLRNPNRAGDMFTWLSWRAQDRPDAVSMSQDFLTKGRERSIERFKRKYGIAVADFKQRRTGIDYKRFLGEGRHLPEEEEAMIEVVNAFIETNPGVTLSTIGKDDPRIETINDYFNEYNNWMGTAIRLERLRVNLVKTGQEYKVANEKDKKSIDTAHEKAGKILDRMVKLQPHRLYLVSKDVRERVDFLLDNDRAFQRIMSSIIATGATKDDVMARILDNLSLVEEKLLLDREALLDRGETFVTLSLNNYYSEIGRFGERTIARIFARTILNDYNAHSDKYLKEFTTWRREFKHGFVLWTGDVPLDEFNASALGPTGAFVRRARDNKAAGEAIKEEITLLTHLSTFKSPHEVIEQLEKVFEKVASYDAGRAHEVIAEKAEAIAKFYSADFLSNIPLYGPMLEQMGYSSFAQFVYGKTAMVWHAQQTKQFFQTLKDRNRITPSQFKVAKERTFSGLPDVAIDIGSIWAQYMALALAFYLAEKLFEEAKGK